jgi:dTDP-4-dehydrorhamnose 3,5-epimerase
MEIICAASSNPMWQPVDKLMEIIAASLPEALLLEPRVFRDERGFFLETFNEARFIEHGLTSLFRQDNHSRSIRGVLRGLHYQLRFPQGKLVTVVHGDIFDVAVDIRLGSPRFGQWTGVTLRADSPRSVWIPPGFAHGFCVLSDSADVVYKCTDVYHAEDERGVLWSDPTVGIEWPVAEPALSDRDLHQPLLTSGRADLPIFQS